MVEGPRGLMKDELDELVELVNKVFKWNMRECFPTLFCEENVEHLRIIKVDGKIVSHIGIVVRDMVINGCRISVGNVGAVCTHEDYRKRGYAWSILENAIEELRSEGVDMLLVSGFRSLYEKHGCTHVGKVSRYVVTRDEKLPQTEAKAVAFSVDDLPAWSTLYRREPVRFHRPYDDFYKLTTNAAAYRGKLPYSIWENEHITAYAALDQRESERGKYISLDEYAGSRQSLLGVLRFWHEEFDVSDIVIPVPAHDAEFSRLLDSVGAKANFSSTGGTVSIINFPALCKKLVPMFEEIVGKEIAQRLTFMERDGSYIIGLDGEEALFDDVHDVARLLFGNPPGYSKQTDFKTLLRGPNTAVPIQSNLCTVLKTIFPIPRPEYGLSYI